MMLVAWPVVDACATCRTGSVFGRRVVLGDDDHRGRERESDQRGAEEAHRRYLRIGRRDVAHHPVGDEPETDRRQGARDHQAAVERVHDLAALARLDEIAADDRRQDREAAQHERIGDRDLRLHRHQQCAQQHRRDDRHRIGLEQVGRHARAVADVVADVVGDHRRIARVVFRDARLDLADEVGADVRALGEDAAAKAREDRDQRTAEREADERLDRVVQSFLHQVRRAVGRTHEEPVEAGDAEQTEADDEHARDRSTAERDRERFVQSRARRLGRAHVRAHGDVHPDVAGEAGEDGADREARRRRAPSAHQMTTNSTRPTMPMVRYWRLRYACAPAWIAAAISRIRSLPVGLRHDPADRHDAIDDRGNGADEREHEF